MLLLLVHIDSFRCVRGSNIFCNNVFPTSLPYILLDLPAKYHTTLLETLPTCLYNVKLTISVLQNLVDVVFYKCCECVYVQVAVSAMRVRDCCKLLMLLP